VTKDGDQVALAARLDRNTQNPLSSLRNVTRSTRPARTSLAALVMAGCTMVKI
jgi:hypothetical protein